MIKNLKFIENRAIPHLRMRVVFHGRANDDEEGCSGNS